MLQAIFAANLIMFCLSLSTPLSTLLSDGVLLFKMVLFLNHPHPLPPVGAPDAAAAAATTEEHNHHEAGHCNDDDDGEGIHWRRRRATVLKVCPL